MDIVDFLSGVRGFDGIERDELEILAGRFHVADFTAGETLIRRGDPGDSMHVVFTGEVRIPVFDERGRIRLVARLGPGEVFGEMALLTGERRRADVIAEGAVQTLVIEREALAPFLAEHPPLARFLTEILGRRLEQSGGVERVGKYRLLDKLGEGATSKVFEALHPGLNRTVAIKMLGHHLVYDARFRDRFLDEARTIAGLSHPNIVQIYDTEQAYATWFIVMEKIEGGDLAAALRESGPLPAQDAADILIQVARGLRFAHERGIVHRDVKPANTAVDPDGGVKIMDFGIARRIKSDAGQSRIVEGTPHYLSPEAIQGLPIDGRADIYSLGVMAWEMLVGRPPFLADDVETILRMHLGTALPDIRTLRPDLPEGLLAFVRGTLEKDPDRRLSDWGKIEALLEGGDAAEAALDRFEEQIVRIRYKPNDRRRVDRAVDQLRGRLRNTPWADVAVAVLEPDRPVGSELAAANRSWLSRLAGLGTDRAEESNSATRPMPTVDPG